MIRGAHRAVVLRPHGQRFDRVGADLHLRDRYGRTSAATAGAPLSGGAFRIDVPWVDGRRTPSGTLGRGALDATWTDVRTPEARSSGRLQAWRR